MGKHGKVREFLARAGQGVAALGKLALEKDERRTFLRGLREPAKMHRRHKVALVLLVLLAGALLWGAGRVVLHLLGAPTAAWDSAWTLAAGGFLGTAVLPFISYDPILFAVRDASGAPAAVLAASIGVTLGALVVWFIGGAVRGKLETWKTKAVWLRKVIGLLEKAARKGSYAALAVMAAIPFFPDSIPVYLFSMMGLRLGPFLGAVFLGTLVRSTIIVVFAQHLGLGGA